MHSSASISEPAIATSVGDPNTLYQIIAPQQGHIVLKLSHYNISELHFVDIKQQNITK